MNWITFIQAVWKGAVQRMRYKKIREDWRKKNTRFPAGDLFETVSKRRLMNIYDFDDANEALITEKLKDGKHKYLTSGATY